MRQLKVGNVYKSFRDFLVENTEEAVITFGRFNPPTTGHEKLLDKVAKVAGSAKYFIFASQSSDAKKNPLSYEQKIKFMRKMFPKHARSIMMDKSVKNMLNAAVVMYDKGFKKLTVVVGSDRVSEFNGLLNKYNGENARHGFYNFEGGINVVSAGERDPDAEGVTGMSASKMRAAASDNDFATFSKGLPSKFRGGKDLFNAVRAGMGLEENASLPKVQFDPVNETREAYVRGELFEEGQQVRIKTTGEEGTVKVLGANYLVMETADSPCKRVWLDNIEVIEEDITQKQLDELEKFADKLLAKFDIDIEFTRHFVDRVNDDRNTPEVKVSELQKFFKKIHKAKGNKIKTVNDLQAVLKDVTTQLNIPAVIKRKPLGDFEVTLKTIMRKKDFKSTSPSVEYK